MSNSLGANFLLGQNKGLIRPGDTNPPQILELRDAERRFGPKLEPLAWESVFKKHKCLFDNQQLICLNILPNHSTEHFRVDALRPSDICEIPSCLLISWGSEFAKHSRNILDTIYCVKCKKRKKKMKKVT